MTYVLKNTVEINGREVPVRTDFRVILTIFSMLHDPDLSDADKQEALLRMFYLDRPDDEAAAVEAFLNFVCPRPHSTVRKHPGLVDWEYDFPLIVAPVNHILGCECRSADFLDWRTFLAAYMDISPESTFVHVIRIREKLKTGKKLEKHERDFLRKNRDLVVVPGRYTEGEKDILQEWT